LGHTFFVFDSDGPIRRAVPFVRQETATGNAFYPSLSLATAMLVLHLDPSSVNMAADGLHVGSRIIPLLDVTQEYVDKVQTRHMLIPYKGAAFASTERTATTYPSYRFWDLFLSELQLRDGKKPEVDPSLFRDKIVFVGTTAEGLHDVFLTPYGDAGKMPGIQ